MASPLPFRRLWPTVTAVPIAFALVGCAPAWTYRELRIRTSPFPSAVADGSPLRGEELDEARAERVVLQDDADSLWEHARRVLIDRIEASPPRSLTLDDGVHRVTTVVPDDARSSAMTDLWIVDVGHERVLFGLEATTLDALVATARGSAIAPSAFVLVRGEDRARFGDVVRVLEVLESVVPRRTVLGAFTAATAKPDGWLTCPFPAGKEDDGAKVGVVLDMRADGKVGKLHVVHFDRGGDRSFGPAAAFCASRQRLGMHAGERGYRVRVNFAR